MDKIRLLGGRFVTNFVVGKTATLDDLKAAGFWRIFVGTGAGLPKFMNVPGEHLNGVMSANEFLTRVNLMHGNLPDYDTPLPEVAGKEMPGDWRRKHGDGRGTHRPALGRSRHDCVPADQGGNAGSRGGTGITLWKRALWWLSCARPPEFHEMENHHVAEPA
ncbi:hypothetical protein [Mobiluncus holmesii]|nr:putative bifunctional glutamate synthase subunit beta/2-polyprenylphenol hydroxylase [Mobiluncus holmesii]